MYHSILSWITVPHLESEHSRCIYWITIFYFDHSTHPSFLPQDNNCLPCFSLPSITILTLVLYLTSPGVLLLDRNLASSNLILPWLSITYFTLYWITTIYVTFDLNIFPKLSYLWPNLTFDASDLFYLTLNTIPMCLHFLTLPWITILLINFTCWNNGFQYSPYLIWSSYGLRCFTYLTWSYHTILYLTLPWITILTLPHLIITYYDTYLISPDLHIEYDTLFNMILPYYATLLHLDLFSCGLRYFTSPDLHIDYDTYLISPDLTMDDDTYLT